MIGGGIQQLPAVERAQAMGYRCIVTDRSVDAPCFDRADLAARFDADDVGSIAAWVLANQARYDIKGVFTLTNKALTVASVSAIAGLPGIPPGQVIRSDNKLLAKRAFDRHGLPTPRWAEVETIDSATKAYHALGGAGAYLKAVDACGGKGILRIESQADLDNAVARLLRYSQFPSLILEEAVSGLFVDVQGIIYDGRFMPAGIGESYFTHRLPDFRGFNPVEDYNVSPAQIPGHVAEACYGLLQEASRALEIDFGPVAADLVLTTGGLELIEMTPRLHGPNGTLQIFPAATGIQPFEAMLQCLCGVAPQAELLQPKHQGVAICKVVVSAAPVVRGVSGFAEVAQMPGVFRATSYWRGDPIVQQGTELAGLGSLFIFGQDLPEARARLKLAESVIVVNGDRAGTASATDGG